LAKTIDDYKKDYEAAKSRGDAAGMKAANDGANAIRRSTGQKEEHASVDIAKTAVASIEAQRAAKNSSKNSSSSSSSSSKKVTQVNTGNPAKPAKPINKEADPRNELPNPYANATPTVTPQIQYIEQDNPYADATKAGATQQLTPEKIAELVQQILASKQGYIDTQTRTLNENAQRTIQQADADSARRGLSYSDYAGDRVDKIRTATSNQISDVIANMNREATSEALAQGQLGLSERQFLENAYAGREALEAERNNYNLNLAGLTLEEKKFLEDAYMGREGFNLNQALAEGQLTGYYNGERTLAGAQADRGIAIQEADLTGFYNGQATLAQRQQDINRSLQEGQLTGYYNGGTTLARDQYGSDTAYQNSQIALAERELALKSALERVQSMGKVTTQEDANLLGVPIGTPSAQASQAAAELAQRLQIAKISAQGTSTQQSTARINQLLDIWKINGAAPPGLESFGIQPGTQYKDAERLLVDRMYAQRDEEESINNLAKQYGTNVQTAEIIYGLMQDNVTADVAYKELQAMKSSAFRNNPQTQLVDVNKVEAALRSKFDLDGAAQSSRYMEAVNEFVYMLNALPVFDSRATLMEFLTSPNGQEEMRKRGILAKDVLEYASQYPKFRQ
jgi:hypothetical protein